MFLCPFTFVVFDMHLIKLICAFTSKPPYHRSTARCKLVIGSPNVKEISSLVHSSYFMTSTGSQVVVVNEADPSIGGIEEAKLALPDNGEPKWYGPLISCDSLKYTDALVIVL